MRGHKYFLLQKIMKSKINEKRAKKSEKFGCNNNKLFLAAVNKI